ncbi:MAG: LysM peptidoglycan-binding domain-containing protein [Deltaproteobacteria bacterium]|nr:LysM peptidoglycan-binding domain-containing protein [Deltaproteobacteria bacterium]
MSQHTVQQGDTLWEITRRHRIRYWPNIYFATENNAFRVGDAH